jgi:putative transposase
VEGYYHVWFSTKGRKTALEDDIGNEVKIILAQIAHRTGIELLGTEAVADHAHLLVRLSGPQTLSSVMHQLKGASARHIFLKYPDLRFDMAGSSFWQKGYGWRRIDPKEIPSVLNYIRTQRQRPLRHDT